MQKQVRSVRLAPLTHLLGKKKSRKRGSLLSVLRRNRKRGLKKKGDKPKSKVRRLKVLLLLLLPLLLLLLLLLQRRMKRKTDPERQIQGKALRFFGKPLEITPIVLNPMMTVTTRL